MSSAQEGSSELGFRPWSPEAELPELSSEALALSQGFLQSNFSSWFPGFSHHWLPLAHSLGVELRVHGLSAFSGAPEGDLVGFSGTIEDEPIGMVCDPELLERALEQGLPRANPLAANIFFEYIVRRFFASLSISWSGPEDSVIRFEPEISVSDVRPFSYVRVVVLVNGMQVPFFVLLGRLVTQRLDALSKKENRLSRRPSEERHRYWVEVAELAVPAAALPDYTTAGALIDLEIPISNRIVLASEVRRNLTAELFTHRSRIAVRVRENIPAVEYDLPSGSIRLRIVFGDILLSPEEERGQTATDIAATNQVRLVVGEDTVATGVLGVYESRFAVQVESGAL